MAEVGIPAGVVNIVPGYGHVAGAALAEHPDVAEDRRSPARPRSAGESSRPRPATSSACSWSWAARARTSSSPTPTWPRRSTASAFAIFHNQGQACIAGSRLHPARADRRRVPGAVHGAGPDASGSATRWTRPPRWGRSPPPQHRDRVLAYVKVARDEGGEILSRRQGPRRPGLARGCYVEPTVVRADPGSRVAARRCSARS